MTMAHYALINQENIVVAVHVGRDENDTDDQTDWETYYSTETLVCKRTSYNTHGGVHLLGGTPFRKNFAAIGYTYDEARDAFIPPQPYLSWFFNEETCLWDPPIPYPNDDNLYMWDETSQQWVKA